VLSAGLARGCEPDILPGTFESIARVLKARYGFSLDGYKDKCVKRRISIRIRATQSPSAEEYSSLLTESAAEQELLLRVLTIHVSHFFRNPTVFQKIAEEIIPELLERRPGLPVRVKSVGCAGGEEPYSLAILLRERFAGELASGRFELQASDVDEKTLELAREALYHPDRLAELSPERLTRWFSQEGARFRLSREVSSLVGFRRADLNDCHPLEECELILCRNVLIYFDRQRQEAVLNGFADALSEGGVLILGKSETLFGSARRRFRTVCPVERIYRVV